MLRKVAVAFGCLIGLFVVAAIALPMFVDVDKFRPQIVQAVNEHINGDFKLGKLKLSLWGGLHVSIESLSIQAKGETKPILSTDSAHLEIPLLSILTMSPEVDIVLEAPHVDVVRGPGDQLNLTALIKQSPATTPPPATPAASTSSSGVPAIVAGASLGLRIEKGIFSFTDQQAGGKYLINGLVLTIKNLGLNKTIEIAAHVPVEGTSSAMSLTGDLDVHGKITPTIENMDFKNASGDIQLDATDLAFSLRGGMVHKEAKIPLTLNTEFVASKTAVQIKTLDAKLAELALNVKGTITLAPQMAVNMDIQSSQIDLASLQGLVPMLKQYGLAGKATLQVHAEGPTEKLAAHGTLGIQGGKASYSALLTGPVSYDLKTAFTENSLNISELHATGPGLDSRLKGEVQNFKAPQFNFALNAQEIDVDKLLKQEPAAKKSAAAFLLNWIPAAEAAISAGGTGNPMLPLTKNPMVAGAAGTFTVDIAKLISKGATITSVMAKMALKNMVFTVESASLKAFNGVVNAKVTADLKSAGLTFKSSGDLKSLIIKNALTAFVPKFKNTLEGTGNATWNMSGAAFPKEMMLHSLLGTFHIDAQNGQLHTMDINESIKGSLSKVPFMSGKALPNISQGFKSMRAEMKFNSGTITADPLEVIGDNRGVNIKGKSTIKENATHDLFQDTYVDVFDPNGMLPKEVSNGKDAALQLHMTGPLASPQTDYGYTASRLAKNVVRNQGSQAIGNQLKKFLGGSSGSGSSPGAAKTGDMVNKALKGLGF